MAFGERREFRREQSYPSHGKILKGVPNFFQITPLHGDFRALEQQLNRVFVGRRDETGLLQVAVWKEKLFVGTAFDAQALRPLVLFPTNQILRPVDRA